MSGRWYPTRNDGESQPASARRICAFCVGVNRLPLIRCFISFSSMDSINGPRCRRCSHHAATAVKSKLTQPCPGLLLNDPIGPPCCCQISPHGSHTCEPSTAATRGRQMVIFVSDVLMLQGSEGSHRTPRACKSCRSRSAARWMAVASP